MSLLPQASAVFQDDEEWLSRLIADAQAIESFPSSLFIEGFLKDCERDTSRWSDWIQQAEQYGFHIPRDISFLQPHSSSNPASTQTQTPLTARLTESFVHAITLLLNISRDTAVELTTTTLATSSVNIAEDHFEAGLELILKIVECFYRQRMARFGLLTELLRLEQVASAGSEQPQNHSSSSSSSKAKEIVQQLDPYNLFAILLMAAVPREYNSLPSSSLSRPQRDALQVLPKQVSFASFVANLIQIQSVYSKQQQIKAMEALIALCYEHVTVQRAHLILVLVAFPEQTTNDLVGMWGVEGLALWKDTADHPLLQGTRAPEELKTLAKLWQGQCLASRPFTLMVLGLGLLLQAAQLPESADLLETANNQDAFGYLYEVLTKLIIRPARSDKSSSGDPSELDASSLMYAGIGREVVSSAITSFSHNLGNVENVDIFCMLAAIVTQNSPTMTKQFWVDWAVYTKTSEERPLCVLLDRAHQFAQQNQSIPFLRLAASIVSSPQSVRVVLDDFLPPTLFSQALQVKPTNEDHATVVLESIRTLAHHATTCAIRQTLCHAIDPKLLWQKVLECNSERASAAGLEALSLLLDDNVEWTRVIADSFHWIADEVWHSIVSRGNQTTEAAAHFLSSLFQSMTTIFFAPDTKETFILGFFEYFRHALMAVASPLSTSVPMLSKPVLVGQTQLTYRSAVSIIDCLRITLQYAGPMEALHPSFAVCQAAADFRWSIISSISSKAIVYYATVPVSLSIVRLLDEGVRDTQLAQIKNDSDSFQNWLSSVKPSSSSDNNLLCVAVESLETPELLSFDFSDVTFQQGDTPEMPIQAASSAIDLFQLCCNAVESRRHDGINVETTACAWRRQLSAKGDLPQLNPTTSRAVLELWSAASVSYAGLFARYIQFEASNDLNASLAEKAIKLLVKLSEHASFQADESFFHNILGSKSLIAKLGAQVEFLISSNKDEVHHEVSTDCISILAYCASCSPQGVGQILTKSSWETMSVFVQNTCSIIVAQRQRGSSITAVHSDLAIAKGCLHLILSWRKATFRMGLHDHLDLHSGFLHQLLKFLSVCVPSEDEEATAGILFDLRRLALDLLANEMSFIPTHQFNDQHKTMIAELENVGRDLLVLVSTSNHYLELRHLGPLCQMFDHYFGTFKSAARKSLEQTLGYFFNGSDQHGQKRTDTSFALTWLSMFRSNPLTSLIDLSSAYSQFVDEINLLVSWKTLLTIVAVQKEAAWQDSVRNQVLSMPMKQAALATLVRNLETIERIQPQSLLLNIYRKIVARLSFMSLHHSRDNEDWQEAIRLIAECCKKIVKSNFPLNDLLVGVEQLLASSATILSSVRPSYDEILVIDVCISLAEVICQVIVMVESYQMSSGQHSSYLGCLSICISVLAALTLPQAPAEITWGGHSGFHDRMYTLLKEYNVIQSLALQISSTTKNDGLPCNDGLASQCDAMILFYSFLSQIAVVGDAHMLSVLAGSELELLLPKRTKFSIHNVDSCPMRGYLEKSKLAQHDQPSDETPALINRTSLERGSDDPLHKVWRSSIAFIAAALRSATTQNDTFTQGKYCCLALDLLSANTETIKACLKQCSSISVNQNFPVLTMNALKEAGLILSLASELCSKGLLETFQTKYSDLYKMFLDLSMSLLAGLSCFIGSSTTSRELFHCIDKVEDADAMALDSISHLSDLNHMCFTVAGGVSNARHEAIRHSHFASRCSAPVTLDDFSSQGYFPPRYKPDERLRTNSDPHSLYSLEHKCREAVTNTFSFQLEVQAARVLFHAVQIISRTHPTASSLVMPTGKESHQLTVPIIQEGTKIAINLDPESPIVAQSEVLLVEVVRCDTVNRRWEVCSWQNGDPVYSVVSQQQIIGIEDISRRRGLLSSAPALRSSAELESVGSASLGHLILTLRWCGRYEDALGGTDLVAKRLAEICTNLLTTEVLVHRESGTLACVEILSLQLMDLYGAREEFSTLLEDYRGSLFDDCKGQLQAVLNVDIWLRARELLHDEIHRAIFRPKNRVHGRFHAASPRFSPRKSAVHAFR